MLPKIIGEGAESTEELLKESEIEFWQATKKFYSEMAAKLPEDSKLSQLSKVRLAYANLNIKALSHEPCI